MELTTMLQQKKIRESLPGMFPVFSFFILWSPSVALVSADGGLCSLRAAQPTISTDICEVSELLHCRKEQECRGRSPLPEREVSSLLFLFSPPQAAKTKMATAM